MKLFICLMLFVFLNADIFIRGHIHVGDNYFDNYIPPEPLSYKKSFWFSSRTYFMYLDYPSNFYLSKDSLITGVELVNANGIESDSNIKVYIDGNLVGTGADGSNIIIFDSPVSLSAGYHTVAVRGSCYRRDIEVSCNRRNADNDDFYFSAYRLFSVNNENTINFDERFHIGDSDDDEDYYDDLSDDNAIPFLYPDSPVASRGVKYSFKFNCDISSMDINLTRVRDVYQDNLDYVSLYVNDNLVKKWYIPSNNGDVENVFFTYNGKISKDDNISVVVYNDYVYINELDDISWDEAIFIPHCIVNKGSFDAWDEDENITTKNIKTKIVSKKFNIKLASLSEDGNALKPFFGTVCSRVISDNFSGDWNETHWSGEREKNVTFNINRAIKDARVNIRWAFAYKHCPLNEYNETNSSDNFAIRPDRFNITNIPPKIKAGDEFNLTIQALDYNNSLSKDYNETFKKSVTFEYKITKDGCNDGKLNLTNGKNFKDGETNATFTYNEVGDLNITIKEINGSEFAKVDEDDTSDNKRLITPVTKTLKFIPHHFKVEANISNFDDNFTYLDSNLSIYSTIDLNITAQNKNNKTTTNYNTKCFAKDVDVNLTPFIFRHNQTLSKNVIYKVFLRIYNNSDINFSVDKSNFTTDNNGSALIKIYVNFDRNISKPISPFEYNLTNAEVNDSDTNLTFYSLNGKALFYYGSLNMNDVITSKNDFNISHEFIIFDNNSSDSYLPQNTKEIIINWYLNTLNKLKDANISSFAITKGYVYDDNIINSVKISVTDVNSSLNLNIKREDLSIKFAVVHIIDENASYLWYSKFNKEYNISKNSSCASHFCFSITWNDENNESGVITGDINGTKADVNSSKENKKGVKLFR